MEQLYPWLGDLNRLDLGRPAVVMICTLASVFCGAIIGLEREKRDKPAGLRTVILIAVGTTIFTIVSLLLASMKPMADPARLVSQVLPGVGFLGAGAIMHARGTVVGLTTGATIWAVAAVGVTIGIGHVAAGIAFSLVILVTLTTLQRVEQLVTGRCRFHMASIEFEPDSGKTRAKLQALLDRYRVPEAGVIFRNVGPTQQLLETRVCLHHREHRRVLGELAELPQVVSLDVR
jgi:putative Mg2+ transporter-C (MgtC) family protein